MRARRRVGNSAQPYRRRMVRRPCARQRGRPVDGPRGVDHSVTVEVTRSCTAPEHGVLGGDDVDDESRRSSRAVDDAPGAVAQGALAGQLAAVTERHKGVGAPLVQGARVGWADRPGEFGEPPVEDGRGGGGKGAAQVGHAVGLAADGDVARGVGGDATLLDTGGVQLVHGSVDGVDDPPARPGLPGFDAVGQQPVEHRHHLPVDELGAADEQMCRAPVDPALGQQRGDLRQAGVEGLGVTHHGAGGQRGQIHHGGHLGGGAGEARDHCIPRVIRSRGVLGLGSPVTQ